MPPQAALLLTSAFVAYMYWRERKRPKEQVSAAIWWPIIWYLVCSTRPIGVWFQIWGVPMPSGGGVEEGSPVDRNFYSGLIVIGWIILARRSVAWDQIAQRNGMLIAFVVYMLLSVMWSDFINISFKRYVKLIGSITMALVVLTERDAFAAVTTIIRRTVLLHIPMSIMCIRYYRDIAISWSWDGSGVSWQGLATSKNTLGQVAMVAAIYFVWELARNWKKEKWKNFNMLYLLMSVYLLKGSDDALSLTSISVFSFALFIFWRLNLIRKKGGNYTGFVNFIMVGTFGFLGLVTVHSIVMFSEDSLFGWLIVNLGRDITLTDRTVIWSQVYDVAARNPLMGVGFGGFWIGRVANIPFTMPLTWTLAQAHSGYVDTYLHLGVIGVFFICGIILKTSRSLIAVLNSNFDAGRFFMTLLLTIVYVNITETTYLRGDNHMWFLFQIVIWRTYIRPATAAGGPPAAGGQSISPLEQPPTRPRFESLGYS